MTREEAINVLNDYDINFERNTPEEVAEAHEMAIKALKTQQKTGHWIGHREHCERLGVMPSGLGAYEWCSNCDYGIDIRDWSRINHNYCPNCGSYNGGAK